MKRIITSILIIILAIFNLTACGESGAGGSAVSSGSGSANGTVTAEKRNTEVNEQLKIVTTIFPEYDWVNNLLGENPAGADAKLLLDNGVDLHSYQPTVDDILTISTCDLFIYVGGESDEWVTDVLESAMNPDLVVINLMDVLGDQAKEEELAPGMQDEGHGLFAKEEEEETEYDEHVWLSLKNAELFCEKIAATLEEIDPEHAETYRENADAYIEELQALDAEYQSAVSESKNKTLLFGDRFPFRYLADDYGLEYYAAFIGCAAEAEASFETILFLVEKTNELHLPAVMTIEGGDKKLAETIARSTETKDQKVLSIDSMQSVTRDELKAGISYLSVMEDNLQVLREALGGS